MEDREELVSNGFNSYDVQTGVRRSRSDRRTRIIIAVLGVALAAAVVVIIGLAAGLGVEMSKSSPSSSNDVCMTPSCVELSQQILASLDDSIDPCDDVYKFACNRFVQNAIIPDGTGVTGNSIRPRELNVERLRNLLKPGNDMGIDAVGKAITYYQSCYTGDTQQAALQTFHSLIRDRLGGWPLIGIYTGTTWSINSEGYLLEQLYGSGAFFNLLVLPDLRNSSRNITYVDQSGLTLFAPGVYTDPTLRNILTSFMLQIFELVNPTVPDATYLQAIFDILNFEAAIANIYDFDARFLTPVARAYEYMTYNQLNAAMPEFNWLQNFQFYGNMGNIVIDQTIPVNVLAPNFIRSLSALVRQTDPTTLQNYAKWQLLYKMLPTMSPEFTHPYYDFQGESAPPRYKPCIDNVEMLVPLPIARIFTQAYLPPVAQSVISIVLRELETALTERLNNRVWLDDTTKARAVQKLRFFNEFVAFPHAILNNTYLNNVYSTLSVSSTYTYLQNDVNARIFARTQSILLADVNRPNNRTRWWLPVSAPTTQNAVYFGNENQIYIFEGLLDMPFFNIDWPFYYQFGSMGFVVGHEYTHGFDNNGRRTNEFGNVENWWTQSSEDNFNSRVQCFINQYNRYSLPNAAGTTQQLNGTFTLGENIADNGGIRTAYLAYRNYIDRLGLVEQRLPGLSYNTDQLFFIASAQLWCQVATPLRQAQQLAVDVHSPDPIRPVGALTNSPEFAAAFDCPVGSPMNPANKCELY